MSPLLVVAVVFAAFFVIMAVLFVIAGRYKKVGPNQVLVISGGRKHTIVDPLTGKKETLSFRLVKGGSTLVLPVVERVDELSLEIMTLDVNTPKVYTLQGVAVTVDGVAQVKIRGDDVS